MIRVVEGAPPGGGNAAPGRRGAPPSARNARRARSTRRGRPVPCGGGRRENAAARSPSVSAPRLATTRPRASDRDSRALGLLNAPGRPGRRACARNLVEGRCHVTSATCRVLVVGASAVRAAVGACPVINFSEPFLIQRTWNRRSAGGGPPRACGANSRATKSSKGVGVASRMRQRARAHCGRCRPSAAPVRTLEVDDRVREWPRSHGRAPPFHETAEIHGDRLRFRWRCSADRAEGVDAVSRIRRRGARLSDRAARALLPVRTLG